jgi:hypothetical protein
LLGRIKPPDELANRIFPVGDRAQAAYLTVRVGYRYGYGFRMDIQTQKS